MNFNEFLNESSLKPMGLSKDETKKVAETFAKAISKLDGVKCTVNTRTLEEDSFDLDLPGDEYAGGSYSIDSNGNVYNNAMGVGMKTPPVYGKWNDSVDTIIKNIKKIHESVVSEAAKFKNTENFEDFLEEIDGMPESAIKKIMGKDYIDTPGNYAEEAEDYDNDIIEYMISNMGRKEFEKLQDWWENNVAESVTNESKLNLGLSTSNYPAGTIGRYRIESTVINLRKVVNLSKDSWSKYSRAFGDDEIGFETSNDRKEALAAIQKSFDNGHNDLREFELDESVVSEAARVGHSSWSSVLSDLKKDGWDIKGKLASKYYDEDEEERRLEIDNVGDEIWWTIYDGDGKEINYGSFDGEGLSAGELDGEVWNYIEESTVNERNITIKRQYTENHPAIVVGKAAKIRNKVLEAIKDGKISQEEFDVILKEMTTDSKRWLRRNSQHFNISEDGISLSKSGKAILKNVMVSEATTKAPKIWVPGGFDKAISKYPNNKITRKIVLDAAVKWDVDPEDAIKYVEFGWAVDLDENKNTKDMKTKFIYESFSEFVENKLNEGTLNEAFASAKLASLLTGAEKMPKDLPKAFYTMSRIALDKVQDVDIIEMDPETAKKEKRANAVYFYFTTNEKENPFASDSWYGKVPANTLLAITNGQNEWMNVEWMRNNGKSLKVTKRDDSAGIAKSSANASYGTRISSLKQVVELADRAYCMDLDILRARYSTAAIQSERAAAKRDAIAFKSDKDFKAENKARYNAILAQKASELPIDKVVADAIDQLSNQIKDALAKAEKGRYGELIMGLDPKGREVKLSDASNLMRNILDDYQRYVGEIVQAEKEKAAGYGGSYYENSLKQRSKNIMDNVKKIENKNYAW